ncbi:MAG: hypothetical protein HY537_01560 [Deltaproteobacteria bacterium]|nr:hypothetical protein [Deltaproteobacteria bacterium]
MINRRFLIASFIFVAVGCARTEVIESPKTVFIPDTAEAPQPEIIWTSRTLQHDFDYLGEIRVRSWTHKGAIERLVEAARKLKADAVIDIRYNPVGFLNSMEAFAIKYK